MSCGQPSVDFGRSGHGVTEHTDALVTEAAGGGGGGAGAGSLLGKKLLQMEKRSIPPQLRTA